MLSTTPNQLVFVTTPKDSLFFFINSGASLSIAITLYLAASTTALELSCCFFRIKKVSSSILFLSADGNEIQTLPSKVVPSIHY